MPKSPDQLIKEALLSKKLATQEAIAAANKEAKSTKASFVTTCLKKRICSRKKLLELLEAGYGIKAVDIKQYPIQKEAVKRVPTRFAFYYGFMPLAIEAGMLTIAIRQPLGVKTEDDIRTHLGYEIQTLIAIEDDIQDALKKFYGLGADTIEAIDKTELPAQGTLAQEAKIENIEELVEDASVVRLVNQIIFEAYKKRATDIHIEPFRGGVTIRYRTDGVLYDANVPAEIKQFIPAIISRIKIMCNLNIVEKRLPQDGRAVVKTQEQTLDLRISTLPTPYGESMVIRLLPTKMLFDLEKLGLSPNDLSSMENLIHRPHGILFITGPTGSGKTTTLYAALSRLNTRNTKIITIEDPIEYELKGITQIQIASDIGLSFATGLRSILRHDPDIIMVGEVRDLETAEIAIRVALTGHLVFSTLHTKDAPSGIARLIDIGIEPYLVASSIEAFIAQRLVRVLCPQCKRENADLLPQLRERIAKDSDLSSPAAVRIFTAAGCDNCNGIGFVGRTGIYEILLMDEVIRDLVTQRVSSEEIKRVAIERGMHTLRYDGWQKVLRGITTPGEVMRVVSSDQDTAENQSTLIRPESISSSFLETRMYPRLTAGVNIHYHIISSKDELIKKGYAWDKFSITKDISAGGVAFVAGESIPIGTLLEVNLELPDGQEPITCLAKVSRVKEIEPQKRYETGICFLDLTGSERSRIKAFVVTETET